MAEALTYEKFMEMLHESKKEDERRSAELDRRMKETDERNRPVS